MTYRVTVSTIIEADIMVEADSEDEAFDKVFEDERLLSLLIDDLKSLEFDEKYITVHS